MYITQEEFNKINSQASWQLLSLPPSTNLRHEPLNKVYHYF